MVWGATANHGMITVHCTAGTLTADTVYFLFWMWTWKINLHLSKIFIDLLSTIVLSRVKKGTLKLSSISINICVRAQQNLSKIWIYGSGSMILRIGIGFLPGELLRLPQQLHCPPLKPCPRRCPTCWWVRAPPALPPSELLNLGRLADHTVCPRRLHLYCIITYYLKRLLGHTVFTLYFICWCSIDFQWWMIVYASIALPRRTIVRRAC